MIVDVSNELYTHLKNEIGSAVVYKQYPAKDASFPCVVVGFSVISDPSTVVSSGETHNLITVTVNIYSESQNFNTEISELRRKVDAVLADYYKLNRNVDDEMDNIDPSIYRWVMRYDGTVSSNKIIYRG